MLIKTPPSAPPVKAYSTKSWRGKKWKVKWLVPWLHMTKNPSSGAILKTPLMLPYCHSVLIIILMTVLNKFVNCFAFYYVWTYVGHVSPEVSTCCCDGVWKWIVYWESNWGARVGCVFNHERWRWFHARRWPGGVWIRIWWRWWRWRAERWYGESVLQRQRSLRKHHYMS